MIYYPKLEANTIPKVPCSFSAPICVANGKLRVLLSLNHRRVWATLDTGSFNSMISPKMAGMLRLGLVTSDTFSFSEADAYSDSFPPVVFMIMERPGYLAAMDLNHFPLLGMDYLSKFQILLNFDNLTATFSTRSEAMIGGKSLSAYSKLNFNTESSPFNGYFVQSGNKNKLPVLALDTGSDSGLSIYEHPVRKKDHGRVEVKSKTPDGVYRAYAKLGTVSVDGLTEMDQLIDYSESPLMKNLKAVLGLKFLEVCHKVILNFPGRCIYLPRKIENHAFLRASILDSEVFLSSTGKINFSKQHSMVSNLKTIVKKDKIELGKLLSHGGGTDSLVSFSKQANLAVNFGGKLIRFSTATDSALVIRPVYSPFSEHSVHVSINPNAKKLIENFQFKMIEHFEYKPPPGYYVQANVNGMSSFISLGTDTTLSTSDLSKPDYRDTYFQVLTSKSKLIKFTLVPGEEIRGWSTVLHVKIGDSSNCWAFLMKGQPLDEKLFESGTWADGQMVFPDGPQRISAKSGPVLTKFFGVVPPNWTVFGFGEVLGMRPPSP